MIGATQNIRHGTCPVGLQSNLRTGIMFQCRHEFAVHENEVLTAPLSAGKEPTESLTWYAGFPVWAGTHVHSTYSLSMVGSSPNLVNLWCVQLSIKIVPLNPYFWKPWFKSGLQFRRKSLAIYSEKHCYSKYVLGKNSDGSQALVPRMSKQQLIRAAHKCPLSPRPSVLVDKSVDTFVGFCWSICLGKVRLRAEPSQASWITMQARQSISWYLATYHSNLISISRE